LGLFTDLGGILPNVFVGFIPTKKSWLLEAVDVNNGAVLRVQN
jgi:hypothetical protein